jgi:hypothetical protein
MTQLKGFLPPPWDDLAPRMLAEARAMGVAARGHGSIAPLKVGDLPVPYHERHREPCLGRPPDNG